MITLTIPGELRYRRLVLRVVESACKLVRARSSAARESRAQFDDHVVSAFSEAFNNIAIHGYRDRSGEVRVEIDPGDDQITIRMFDTGQSFDPDQLGVRRPDRLPESGMGLYIIHGFMDVVSYRPGDPPQIPNLLLLQKRLRLGAAPPPDAPKETRK